MSLPGSGKSQTQDLKETTSELERISLAFNRRLKYVIDQESKEIRIKVIDNETDKVIKVLPPEELQRLHSRIRETLGFLFDRVI
ncbi:MAG: flagellar protein FlaG [Treponema sp.]|nr:flagellar protein FlaG [Treponema sp.]